MPFVGRSNYTLRLGVFGDGVVKSCFTCKNMGCFTNFESTSDYAPEIFCRVNKKVDGMAFHEHTYFDVQKLAIISGEGCLSYEEIEDTQ